MRESIEYRDYPEITEMVAADDINHALSLMHQIANKEVLFYLLHHQPLHKSVAKSQKLMQKIIYSDAIAALIKLYGIDKYHQAIVSHSWRDPDLIFHPSRMHDYDLFFLQVIEAGGHLWLTYDEAKKLFLPKMSILCFEGKAMVGFGHWYTGPGFRLAIAEKSKHANGSRLYKK